jgi:hypothetical protein
MAKKPKTTKDALIRVRVTTKQKDVYEERGGPPALREWLDNPTGDKLTPIQKKETK